MLCCTHALRVVLMQRSTREMLNGDWMLYAGCEQGKQVVSHGARFTTVLENTSI